jgi:hypothetical protein
MTDFLNCAQELCARTGNEDCRELLSHFVQSGNLRKSIGSLLADLPQISSIASNSNIHTNGFTKIVLAEHAGWRLRLHVWDASTDEQIHEPHDHRWNFTSYILTGKMINQIWEEQPDGITHDQYLEAATEVNKKRPYQFQRKVKLSAASAQTYHDGDAYFHPTKIAHIARIPADTATMTLILTAPPREESSFIYMPEGQEPPGEVPLVNLTPQQIKSRLTGLLDLLPR